MTLVDPFVHSTATVKSGRGGVARAIECRAISPISIRTRPHPEEARRAVSKGGDRHRACCPCFETLAALAPQHEVVSGSTFYESEHYGNCRHARPRNCALGAPHPSSHHSGGRAGRRPQPAGRRGRRPSSSTTHPRIASDPPPSPPPNQPPRARSRSP